MPADNVPYSYAENGKVSGIEADIILAVAKAGNFEVELTTDSNATYTASAGELTDNSDSFDYTDIYYHTSIVFTVAKGSKLSYYEDLLHEDIGVLKDSMGEQFANEIAPQYNITVNSYSDRSQMYKAIENKEIAGCFDDLLIVNNEIKNGAKLRTFENPERASNLTFATNKGENKEFIENFNSGLDKITKDGTLNKIIASYEK